MKKLRIVIRRKSTVPKNVRGQFFDTRPAVWKRRRFCLRCITRVCTIPALINLVVSPTGICHHCICWYPYRHCCWCGISHHGARMAHLYEEFIARLKELGCLYCEACRNYVSIPHALHPAVNPQPKKITIRNRGKRGPS